MARLSILYSHSGGASKVDVYVHWVRVGSKLSQVQSPTGQGTKSTLCCRQADGNQDTKTYRVREDNTG